MPRIGVDKEAFRKGQSYITLLYDLDRSTVEAISDGNDIHAGNTAFSQLSENQLARVEAIAMDMSAAYVKSAKENIPLAEEKIVHDRFHIMKMATEAVDKVRRGEHRRLVELGDHRPSGRKHLWLTGKENLSDSQRERFDKAFTRQFETVKAWVYKEMLRDLWHQGKLEFATHFFKDWYSRVIHTNLALLKKATRTTREHLPKDFRYNSPGMTNAAAEGLNSKIMAIERRGGGYRNRKNFKTAIYFCYGGLHLYPQ
jgi:transposase